MIVLIGFVVRYINRLVRFVFDAIGRGVLVLPGFHPELAAPKKTDLPLPIWTLGLVGMFPYLPGRGTPLPGSVSPVEFEEGHYRNQQAEAAVAGVD